MTYFDMFLKIMILVTLVSIQVGLSTEKAENGNRTGEVTDRIETTNAQLLSIQTAISDLAEKIENQRVTEINHNYNRNQYDVAVSDGGSVMLPEDAQTEKREKTDGIVFWNEELPQRCRCPGSGSEPDQMEDPENRETAESPRGAGGVPGLHQLRRPEDTGIQGTVPKENGDGSTLQ